MSTRHLKVRPLPDLLPSWLIDLDPVFQRIYAARGVELEHEIRYPLKNMLGIDKIRNLSGAADLLAGHVLNNNQILIFGDYDADGATSTALCVQALRMSGHDNVVYLMPDRFVDGYGLSVSAAARIIQLRPQCVVTVDNGIASLDGIALLVEQGIDVIVTDHHLAASELPRASVIVNQNAWGNETEGKNLAGVGVAFYLMLALRQSLRQLGWFNQGRAEPNLACCLDLVAIGTLADLVPLDYSNRILVNEGLRRIRAGHSSHGIRALAAVSNKAPERLSCSDVGFNIAPKINAAGRLQDITIGVKCLLADNPDTAAKFADNLNEINTLRKSIQNKMALQAQQQLDALVIQELESKQTIVLYQADWHEGIVGIVASKVREKYNRPSIVFAKSEEGYLKGSGRSLPGIHLRDMLDCVDKRYPGVIKKFGGHAMAAGLSLERSNLEQFEVAFNRVVSDLSDTDCFDDTVDCDGSLESHHFTVEFAEALQNLGPWGQRFPQPSFVGKFEVINQKLLAEKHMKFELENSDGGQVLEAIAFFQPEAVLHKTYQQIQIHYELSLNYFRGRESLQLLIRDIL